jgi:hypothetical protein
MDSMGNTIIDTICSVQHVSDCRVIEENGEITQIFVEADMASMNQDDPTQQIKSMVRSIVGALALNHDLDLDYRKIKVIEYKPDAPESEPEADLYPRIQIVAAYQRRIPEPEIVVELLCRGRTCLGVARRTADLGKDTLVACVKALEQIGCGKMEPLYIQELKNEFNSERVVLVKLQYDHPSGSRHSLMGVAEIKEDYLLAIVKAVLSAVNRRLVVAYPA